MNERKGWIKLALVTLAFSASLAFRDKVDPWLATPAAGIFAIACFYKRSLAVLQEMREMTRGSALAAIATGLVLSALTHIVYMGVTQLAPGLATMVTDLYTEINFSAGRIATAPLIALIVFAEEVTWRSGALALLSKRLSSRVLAVCLYAIPQLLSGSWILLAAALGLGAIFVAQRVYYGRTAEPLISHLIWSLTIFCFFPL